MQNNIEKGYENDEGFVPVNYFQLNLIAMKIKSQRK